VNGSEIKENCLLKELGNQPPNGAAMPQLKNFVFYGGSNKRKQFLPFLHQQEMKEKFSF